MTIGPAPRPSATVMLVRDGDHPTEPLEVFMLRRHPNTAFGSIHVFPGGVLDPADRHPDLDGICPGLSDAGASATLDVTGDGRAYWVAAVRECFEEAGVLLARHLDGAPLRLDGDETTTRRFDGHRRALHAGTRSLADVMRAESLVLAVDELRYLSRWITPAGEPKRYDARFFVARAPEGQVGTHDRLELIESGWVRPADALAGQGHDGYQLIEPTIRSLEALACFATADALMAAPTITPMAVRPA